MNLNELLTIEPAQIGHKLGAAAVVTSRMGKQADVMSTVDSIKNHVMDGLKSGNPLYTGAAGALGLGGLSALRESMRNKKDRRWSNVAMAAGLGGIGGAAAPMITEGANTLMTSDVPTKPPTPQTPSLSGKLLEGASAVNNMLPEGWKAHDDSDILSAASHALPADTGTMIGGGLSAHKYLSRGRALSKGLEAGLSGDSKLPVISGAENSAVRDSMNRIQPSSITGYMDRSIAARHGMPDIDAINAARTTPLQPGQSPYGGTSRLRSFLTGSAPTMPANTSHSVWPESMTKLAPPPVTRVPVPTLGRDPAAARAAVQGIRANAPRPGWAGMIPAAVGLGVDLYRNMGQ